MSTFNFDQFAPEQRNAIYEYLIEANHTSILEDKQISPPGFLFTNRKFHQEYRSLAEQLAIRHYAVILSHQGAGMQHLIGYGVPRKLPDKAVLHIKLDMRATEITDRDNPAQQKRTLLRFLDTQPSLSQFDLLGNRNYDNVRELAIEVSVVDIDRRSVTVEQRKEVQYQIHRSLYNSFLYQPGMREFSVRFHRGTGGFIMQPQHGMWMEDQRTKIKEDIEHEKANKARDDEGSDGEGIGDSDDVEEEVKIPWHLERFSPFVKPFDIHYRSDRAWCTAAQWMRGYPAWQDLLLRLGVTQEPRVFDVQDFEEAEDVEEFQRQAADWPSAPLHY